MKNFLTLITILYTTTLVLSGTGTLRTLSAAEKQRIVDNLNTFRNSDLVSPKPKAGTMRTISWDNTLETYARNYAGKCIWGHSQTNVGQRPSSVGENLYMSATSSGILSTQSLIDNGHLSWQNERLFYTLANNSCATGKVCGHYTVIVKDVNNGVGCAIADCSVLDNYSNNALYPNKFYMVCNYNGQNYVGVPPYTADTSVVTPAPTTVVSTPVPTTVASTPAPTVVTTVAPTSAPSTTPSPGVLQSLALSTFDRVNNYRVSTLNKTVFLHSSVATSFLRDFTMKQAAVKNPLDTDLRAGIIARGFGSVAWCYRSCTSSATSCIDVDTTNFLTTSKINQVNSTTYKYFSTAYANNGTYRIWSMIWSSLPGTAPATVLDYDDTLEEESDD